jgi:hypothetical protein
MTDPTIDKAALEACPWCGLTEHLSVRAEGSYTPDMPARPYRVVCNHIDHDTVEGPIGYGRNGAIAAWNRRASPTTSPHAPEGVRDDVLERAERAIEALRIAWSGAEYSGAFNDGCNAALASIRALKGNRT